VFSMRYEVKFCTLLRRNVGSRKNVVGIATGYRLDDERSEFESWGGVKNCIFSMSFRPTLGPTQRPMQCIPGGFYPVSKAAGA
jgi:hypothetical protein